MKDPPLVSCIMPTYNRRRFVPLAIGYFLRQDYPNRELIIVDDGTDPVQDLVPDDPRIRYMSLEAKHSIGAKRNLACNSPPSSLRYRRGVGPASTCSSCQLTRSPSSGTWRASLR